MKWVRVGLVAAFLGMAVLVLTSVQGQQDTKKGRGGAGGGGGRGGFGGMASFKAPLVSSDLSDKLKLTDEQKKAVSKLQAEFEDKTKDSVEKVTAAMKEKTAESRKEAMEVMQTISKTRGEFQDKVKGVLKDEQKKTYEEEVKNQPAPGGRGGPGGGGPGGGFGRGAAANIFSTATQDKLGLSDEQKEKLASLKKEMDSKSLDVLTAEQKKKFEELKSAAPTRPGGGRPKQELNNKND